MIPLFKHILHSLVQSTFPTHLHGRKRVLFDDVFKYVMYILRTGCQWRSLVTSNVSWQTVHRHFCIWSRKGLIEQAYYKLVSIYLQRIGIQQRHIITDTSFIKNINGIDCVGPSSVDRGRKATKISIITDELGVTLGVTFHRGNKCDYKAFLHTFDQMRRRFGKFMEGRVFYADKAYDNRRCASAISKHSLTNNCCRRKSPPNPGNTKPRIVVEHVFSWLDKFRRLFVRYERQIVHHKSLTFIALAHRLEKILVV